MLYVYVSLNMGIMSCKVRGEVIMLYVYVYLVKLIVSVFGCAIIVWPCHTRAYVVSGDVGEA